MPPSLRRGIWTLAVATTFAVFVARSVYTDIAHIRLKLVERPVDASDGHVGLTVNDPLADGLIAPWALIARIRHTNATPTLVRITVGGQWACERSIPPGDSTRIDCAVSGPWQRASDAPAIDVVGSGAWTLEYLEIATHHGNTTGPLMSYVIPRGVSNFVRPSRLWAVLTLAVVAALVFFRPSQARPGAVRMAARVTSVLAMTFMTIVMVAPLVSSYRLVVWDGTVVRWIGVLALLRWWPTAWWSRIRLTAPQAAYLIALGMFALTATVGTRALSGADSYGYVSEADLWLRGDLKIPQAFAADAPWPNADRAFAPLGYQASLVDNRLIVPIYAPGLPMLLALAKLIGGQTAMYFVVPLFAAVLVLATFGLGRRLGSDAAGLIGASLVATSPVVLEYALVAMTDVPVAAAWTLAFYVALGPLRARNAALAGLVAGLAVLIRPNLVALAAILGLHYALRLLAPSERRQALPWCIAYGFGVLPGVVAVAMVNRELYGSPFTSGYGALGDLFAWRRMGPNARNYFTWMVQSQTPAILIGAAAIVVPLRSIWSRVPDRRVFMVIAAFIAALWAIYCAWEVFDTWLFLRFLISSWPFLMIGIGAVAVTCMSLPLRGARPLAIGAVVVVGLLQLRYADQRKIFNDGWAEDRSVAIARFVQRMTPTNSVVICLHHSGSLRYYGGRMTIYFPWLDERSLDTAVEWLAERGVHTYALIEDWEMAEFRTRYASQRLASIVDQQPLAVYREPGTALLFDLTESRRPSAAPVIGMGAPHSWIAPPPVPLEPLRLQPPARGN